MSPLFNRLAYCHSNPIFSLRENKWTCPSIIDFCTSSSSWVLALQTIVSLSRCSLTAKRLVPTGNSTVPWVSFHSDGTFRAKWRHSTVKYLLAFAEWISTLASSDLASIEIAMMTHSKTGKPVTACNCVLVHSHPLLLCEPYHFGMHEKHKVHQIRYQYQK